MRHFQLQQLYPQSLPDQFLWHYLIFFPTAQYDFSCRPHIAKRKPRSVGGARGLALVAKARSPISNTWQATASYISYGHEFLESDFSFHSTFSYWSITTAPKIDVYVRLELIQIWHQFCYSIMKETMLWFIQSFIDHEFRSFKKIDRYKQGRN